MSKKGRSSIVLLVMVVSGLLLAPLLYLALAAQFDPIDQDALDEQITFLQATAVDGPGALQARFLAERDLDLTFLVPGTEYGINHSAGFAVFNPEDFVGWEKALEPAELNGVAVYPVTLAEDPDTRDTIFYNGLNEPIATLAAAPGYDPFAWLADWHPELYAENADPETLAWYKALCDPARVSVTFYLLPVESVEDMARAQLATVEVGRNASMNMMMGEGMPEPVTNLVIFAFEHATNGMVLGIGWPEEFTNNLEVFSRATIAITGWTVASTNLSTAGTNSLWWVDSSITSNTESRYYCVGNADHDSDSDGIADARERMIYGTDENKADSDADGLSDWDELFVAGTDPLIQDTDNDGIIDSEDQYPLIHGPVIVVSDPGTNQTMTQSFIIVTGTVSNEMALREIRVNSQPVGQQSTPTNGVVSFSHSLTFEDGLQEITVGASATNGSASLIRFCITVNATPPSVLIIQPTDYQVFTNQNVRVVVESDSNAAMITVNEQATIRQGYLYSAWITLEAGTNAISARSVEGGQALTNTVYVVCIISEDYPDEDADGDTVLNHDDYFPDDPTEWYDTDADGVGDNADPDPNDPSITSTITIDQPENGITIRAR
jgi:hypothetical protein